jgi:hypothetical protein
MSEAPSFFSAAPRDYERGAGLIGEGERWDKRSRPC